MTRLPIIGGDYDSWGTVLVDYLNETAGLSTLSASTSAGDTTVSLAVVPPGLRIGSLVAIDAFTTQCEIKTVTGVSGLNITVSALMFAHASGDTLVDVTSNTTVSTELYGITASGIDDWQPLTRLFLEAGGTGMGVTGAAYVQQPLVLDSNTRVQRLTVNSRTGFTPIDATGAVVMIANGQFFFKAVGATNVFTSTLADHTTPTNHGLVAGQYVTFSNPYGETLPGNLVSGRIYYIKTTPTLSTFTISATDGGAEFDISSDGTGWSANDVTTGLARIHWESMTIVVNSADLNGLWANLQQPSWTRNLRVTLNVAATTPGAATGFILQGQLSYHDNVEINTHINTVGMQIEGSGHIVRGFNDNGSNSGDTAVIFDTADNCAIHDPWTENCAVGIRLDSCRALEIGGTWIGVMNAAGVPLLRVTSDQTSYRVGLVRCQADGLLLVDDTARGFQLLSGTTDGADDGAHVFGGLRQPYGTVSGPILFDRFEVNTSSNYTARRQDALIIVNTAGGNRTLTLPTPVGWAGWTVTIANFPTSGANVLTVDPVAANLIDSLTTKDLAVGVAITVSSDGAFYWTVGNNT